MAGMDLLFRGPDAIVIIGEQPEMARRALEQQVSCLIVCQAELPEELRQQQTNTCIIATPFDLHVLGAPPAFVLSQDQTL